MSCATTPGTNIPLSNHHPNFKHHPYSYKDFTMLEVLLFKSLKETTKEGTWSIKILSEFLNLSFTVLQL